MEQEPEPPPPAGATGATQLVVPTSTVTSSVPGSSSPLPVDTVTVKRVDPSPPKDSLEGTAVSPTEVESCVTTKPSVAPTVELGKMGYSGLDDTRPEQVKAPMVYFPTARPAVIGVPSSRVSQRV